MNVQDPIHDQDAAGEIVSDAFTTFYANTLAYAKLADELEAQGNEVDARQYRLLVRDLDTHMNEITITQASIEDGTRKPVFLQLASPTYDAVVINAEA